MFHEELSKEIVASADRQQTVIIAEAERTSSILRGEGDASKNKILGDAYSLDRDFFDFLRTMQACRDTFGDTEMSMVIAPRCLELENLPTFYLSNWIKFWANTECIIYVNAPEIKSKTSKLMFSFFAIERTRGE